MILIINLWLALFLALVTSESSFQLRWYHNRTPQDLPVVSVDQTHRKQNPSPDLRRRSGTQFPTPTTIQRPPPWIPRHRHLHRWMPLMSAHPQNSLEGCLLRDFSPTQLRLNMYSKANVIASVASALKGSSAMDRLLCSQFSKLFRLPVARCPNSTKLIGSLLCRQLITIRKYELWFTFDSETEVNEPGSMWKQLFDTTRWWTGFCVVLIKHSSSPLSMSKCSATWTRCYCRFQPRPRS
ncbi:BnaC01g29620D [Brassica napus]|uniref:BnaC01g29620D protein n=1 Tax=Brassica napus TaxID=3708 RepID=A0A078GL11_BRANA|nr:BnaC01g29620D [Brassica napus]